MQKNTARLIWSAFFLTQFIFLAMAYLTTRGLEPDGTFFSNPLGGILFLVGLVNFVMSFKITSFIPESPTDGPAQKFRIMIIQLVLAEVSALLGVVYSQITHNFIVAVPFVALSLVGILIRFPKAD